MLKMKNQHSQKHSMDNNNRFKVRHYDPDFKKKVALFAERRGTREAKRCFGVSESNVRRWRKIQRDLANDKVTVCKAVSRKTNRKRALVEDVPSRIDSMPLEQRLKSPIVPSTSTSEQEQVLHSHPLSPTKLKVTRQSKPKELSPKPITPPPIEEICLKWNSHHGNMQSTFPALLLKEQYVDATLVAEGQTLKCHRMILSSCSPYFEEVLSNISPYQHPVLFMKDTQFWILKCLCDFMYTGEVLISQDKLNELLSAAESLKIKGLAGTPDVQNEDLLREPLHKQIKEEKKEEPIVEREPEKKETVKDKKRYHYAAAYTTATISEPAPPKTSKIPKTISDPPPVKASKIPKLNTYNDFPLVKSSSKVTKVNTSHLETVHLKTSSTKVLRSSSTLKKIERADKLLIKEAISKGDILDPFDLLEPVYEEVQKESKPPNIPNKAKDATKNVPAKKSVQKKVKKRKISDDRDESPPPVLSRKGTRSRPNKKIPRFYHSGFDNSTPKIQESQDPTIVREPHTSQAESQTTSHSTDQVEIHNDQTEQHIESHMDQADPLFQLTDIKAEPFDVEDSIIEIEDNVVTFGEPDTSMTEEELLEETFESVMNFEEKTIPKKKQEPKPFKKIRVTRQQVLLDVEKTSMVKIVDVDKIKVSVDVLEEDPLNLSSNLDNSIKIMNIESISENLQSASPTASKEPAAGNSEVGFKICPITGNSAEEKQLEENPLGFQITSVISEVEEKNVGQVEEGKPTLPVCQIAEVFSETENETNKKPVEKNDDKIKNISGEVSEEEVIAENILKSITEERKNIVIKESYAENLTLIEGSAQRQEDTPESFEGFDFPSSRSMEESLTGTEKLVNNIETCELKNTGNLQNVEDCHEKTTFLHANAFENTMPDKYEMTDVKNQCDENLEFSNDLKTNRILNNTSDDLCETTAISGKIIDGESRTIEGLEQIADHSEKNNDSSDKTIDNHASQIIDDSNQSANDSSQNADVSVQIADELVQTAGDSVQISDDQVLIADDLALTADELGQTVDSLDQTTDGADQTVYGTDQTANDLGDTSDNPCYPGDDPDHLVADSSHPVDDPTHPAADPIDPADDPTQTADDADVPVDGPGLISDVPDPISNDPSHMVDDPVQIANETLQISDDIGKATHLHQTTDDIYPTSDDSGKINNDLSKIADESEPTEDSQKNVDYLDEINEASCETTDHLVKTDTDEDECANEQKQIYTNISVENTNSAESLRDCANDSCSVAEYIVDENIPESSVNAITPQESGILEVRNVLEEQANETERNHNFLESSQTFELKPDICTNSVEETTCLEDTFDQAIVTNDLSTNEDIEMPTDESHTKDPVLANAVPYTNEDLPIASTQNDVLPMEVCEESFSQGAQSFDQTPNSFELADVAQNDSSAYSTPGFHIAQVISEQIALNEECRLTNQPMDTSDGCFEGSMTSSNELEMIVNDLTKIVGESQRLDSNMEHEDITDSLENLLEK